MTSSAVSLSSWPVFEWMIRDLDLSGNELVLYSLIYSHGDDGLRMAVPMIGHMANISPTTVKRTLANLEAKHLVFCRHGGAFEPNTWVAPRREKPDKTRPAVRNRRNRVLSITKSEE